MTGPIVQIRALLAFANNTKSRCLACGGSSFSGRKSETWGAQPFWDSRTRTARLY